MSISRAWRDVRVKQTTGKPLATRKIDYSFGVATISRLLKIIGLFCKRAL